MKIGIIGATGKAGSRILNEALSRGHEVTAIIRHPNKLENTNVSVVEKDIFDLTREDLVKYDIVVNAFGAPMGEEHLHVEAGRILINALKGATHTRLIVVGGAGSLYVDEGHSIKLIDTPEFPDFVKPTAANQGKNLEELKQTTDLAWTFISPSALFALGRRTGNYRLGKDQLLVNSQDESYVSYEDYAVAVLDEIEDPKYINERFTVVSEK
ncbi:NAD(P)-dependent oxidoreductase [Terrilactibacillus laevilacticus]|uniref:NAD(P)-dependent oxidoreductase n=1 Tax=Terrilactibacillus laevilacticus TaxID=1380157 RepID=UPI0011468F3A|nr:NAD(P)-dependent oxidoreductase [Terrilactibacillus laevilacticus]